MYKIVRREAFSDVTFLWDVHAPDVAASAQPGHFVMLRLHEGSERIPLTVADYDPEWGTVTIVVQALGKTTREMMRAYKEGDSSSDFVGPLGLESHVGKVGHVVLVGGGLGVAPVYPQLRAFKEAERRARETQAERARLKQLHWMKCPKCGYNSFEFHDSCKKCNHDLTSFKETQGIRPVFLQVPSETAAGPGKEAADDFLLAPSATAADEDLFNGDFTPAADTAPSGSDFDMDFGTSEENGATDFSFAPASEPESTPQVEEPAFGDFSFDEPVSAPDQPAAPAQGFVDDSFADLLDNSSGGDSAAPVAESAADGFMDFGNVGEEEPVTEPPAGGGGIEMDFFFQEDEPAEKIEPKKLPPEDPGQASDNLDFLFGDPSDDGDKLER